MSWIRWGLVALALIVAGYMAVDGVRALWVGDYFTPTSGRYAGRLGPWSHVVSAVGIEPRSTVMKALFAGYGTAWLVVVALFLRGESWAWWGMLVAAVGSLWYLPVGTLLGVLQIVLLLVLRGRAPLA